MERFLFRAWDDLNKEWLLGYDPSKDSGFSLIGECVLFGEWGNVFDQFLFQKEGKEPKHFIIEQWTGLNDKHGNKAYAGDIIKETRLNGDERFYKIFNVKGGFAINTYQDDFKKASDKIIFYESLADMQTSNWFESSVEIIGNIHEHKHLLK